MFDYQSQIANYVVISGQRYWRAKTKSWIADVEKATRFSKSAAQQLAEELKASIAYAGMR